MPDMAMPDMAAPDVSIPDVSMPDMAMPDMAAPDVSIPDVSMPDMAMPDMAVPDVSIPDVDTPTVASTNIADLYSDESKTQPNPGPEPVERDGAWRRPTKAPLTGRVGMAATGDAPQVVDLAVPQPAPEVEEETPKRSILPALAGLIGLAILVGLAFLIIQLLSGSDDASTAEEATAPPTSASSAPPAEEAQPGPDEVSVFELRAGDCIVGDIGSGQVTEVTKVDCEVEHQFEVYREVLIDSSITTFDEPAISAYAEDVCRTSLEAYVPVDDERALMFKFLQPTEDSWNQAEEPDRVITCLLFDDDAPLIGRAA